MPISVKCDFCGKALRVKEQLAGKKVKCTDCGAHVEIPRSGFDDDDEGGPELRIREPEPRRRSRRDEDDDDRDVPVRRGQGSPVAGLLIGGAAVAGLLILGGVAAVAFLARKPAPQVANNDNNNGFANNGNNNGFGNNNNNPFGQNRNQNPQPFQPMQPIQPGQGFQPENQNPGNNPNPQGFNQPRFPKRQKKQDDAQNDAPQGFKPVDKENQPKGAGARPAMWRGQPDPQLQPPELKLDKPLALSLTKLGPGAIFPRSPSLFVAVGLNRNPRDEREILNLSTGKKAGSIRGPTFEDQLSALSPDGKYFAGKIPFKDEVLVWDIKANKALGTLVVPAWPKLVAFAGNQRLMVVGDKKANFWKIPSGDRDKSIALENLWDADKTVALSHGGSFLAYYNKSFKSPALEVYDLSTGEMAGELAVPEVEHGHPDCEGLAFSSDGAELAGLFRHWKAGIMGVWDMTNGELKSTFQMDEFETQLGDGHRNYKAERLQWFPDRKRWLAYGELVIDRETEKETFKVPGLGGFGNQYATKVLPNGHLLLAQVPGFNKPLTLASIELSDEKLKQASEIVKSGGTAADANLPKLTPATWAGAKKVSLTGSAGTWKVSNDPAPVPKAKLMPDTLNLAQRSLKLLGASVSAPDAARLVVQYGRKDAWGGIDAIPDVGNRSKKAGDKAPDEPSAPAYLDVYDMASGKILSTMTIGFDCQLMAVSPDGKYACVRIADKKDRLDVFEIDGGKHVAGWRPYQDSDADNKREILATVFVDGKHVLTMNNWEKTVALWDVATGKAVYSVAEADNPGVSPGRKYLVVTAKNGKEYRFFDALTGEPKGAVPVPGLVQAAAFHPDGQLLGAVVADGSSHSFVSWKLVDGSVDKEFPLPSGAQSMHWCNRTNVLLDNRRLIDLPAKSVVWNYQVLGLGMELPNPYDVRHYYLMQRIDPRNRSIVVNAVDLPDDAAQQKLLSSDVKPDYVIEPGTTVSVNVNLSAAPPGKAGLATEVAAAFTQILQKNGCSVAAGAPVVVQVTSVMDQVKDGEVVTITEFRGGGRKEIKVERVKFTVTVLRNNQKAWEQTGFASTGGFGLVQKKEGVSWEDQLRGDMWNSFENQLKNYPLPKYVIANGNGLGTSNLTADGVAEGK